MPARQKFDYRIENLQGRVLAKFSLLSEAMSAADALAIAYGDTLLVCESQYEGYVHRTGN